MTRDEQKIHLALCHYIRSRYPWAIFNTDLSGVNMSKAQRGIAKSCRSGKGFPDLNILEPIGEHYGLFIEIKSEKSNLISKTDRGKMRKGDWATKHLKTQSDMLMKLCDREYFATFGIGLDHCISIVDKYFSNSLDLKYVITPEHVISLLE